MPTLEVAMPVQTGNMSPYRVLRAVKRRLTKLWRSAPKPLPRADYKQTWNRMSVGENDAKVGVAGYTDEAQFAATANATLTMLRRTVGIHPTDTVLEIGA